MKRNFILIAAAVSVLTACEAPALSPIDDNTPSAEQTKTKKFTFTLKGDFGAPTFTRGYMSANGQDLTDLLVFDVVGDSVAQSVHLSPSDEQWGAPVLNLSYGAHKVCFVASRGEGLALDTAAHVLTWTSPRDTFWKLYEVEVVGTSNGNRAVTLDRVATKLKITIQDEVPAGIDSLIVRPAVWYYGINYLTGEAAASMTKSRGVKVPATYVGTSGTLTASFFGISPAQEWTTDVAVTAKDASGTILGSATIAAAPFLRNRATEYAGLLFGAEGVHDVSINDTWDDPATGTW